MCRAVAEALVTETHLVVQAGTGTGKSLAYLVPAALSGKKVVVATATKALQDQLADKDLPLVESGLGLDVPLDVAVLKGRSNYICRQRVSEVGAGGVQAELGDQAGGRADEAETGEGAAGGERGRGAPRRTGRGGAPPRRLVTDLGHRRPGRPRLRALGPRLEHAQRRATGVPRRLQLPAGRALLRRGGPRPRRGGRHRRGQHPPLRCAPRQRRGRAARARGRRLRRGARARGGHDREPRGRGHARALPLARHRRPAPGRTAGRGAARVAGDGRRPAGCAARRADRDARAPGRRTWAGPALGRRPRTGRDRGAGRRAEPAGHRRAAAGRGAAQLPGRGRGGRSRPGEPQDPHAAGGRPPLRGPAPPRDAARRRGGLGRRDAAQRAAAPLPHRRRAGAVRRCSGAR